MYNSAITPAAVAAGSLPFTGLNIMWVALVLFTLAACSGAAFRTIRAS